MAKTAEIVCVPNKKQKEFFEATTRYVAYGGARGGGKSWAVRKKAVLLCLNFAGIRVLLVRRSYQELRENHVLILQKELKALASYKDGEKAFIFPNGSRLKLGYLDGESDLLQYQGQEYDCVFIDEATQLTELQFLCLNATVRGANSFPKRVYLTCNPGGVGHAWVKRLFVDRRYSASENPSEYTFIRASVFDNDELMKEGSGYLNALEKLPDNLKKAWLYGDWDIVAGLFFPEFSSEIHVISPFELTGNYRVYGALDYGLDAYAHYYFAVYENGDVIVFDEIFESDLIISVAARRTLGKGIKASLEIAPGDLFSRSQESGKTKASLFGDEGMELTKVASDRESGLLCLKELLQVKDGKSRLRIFSTCKQLVKSLSEILCDNENPSGCAKFPHDVTHAVDAVRYFASYYYSPPQSEKPQKVFWRQDMWEDYYRALPSEKSYLISKWGNPF